MHFNTPATLLFAATFAAPSFCAPAAAPQNPPEPNPNTYCQNQWDPVGADNSDIQDWQIAAQGVNTWDQGKFSRELNLHACAPIEMKSHYDAGTKTVAASWKSSGTCTAGRVTDCFKDSAGEFVVNCPAVGSAFQNSLGNDYSALSAGMQSALNVINVLGDLA